MIFLILIVSLYVTIIFYYFKNFGFDLTNSNFTVWVETAGLFNNLLQPFLLLASVILLFLTWKTTRKELKETREIMKRQSYHEELVLFEKKIDTINELLDENICGRRELFHTISNDVIEYLESKGEIKHLTDWANRNAEEVIEKRGYSIGLNQELIRSWVNQIHQQNDKTRLMTLVLSEITLSTFKCKDIIKNIDANNSNKIDGFLANGNPPWSRVLEELILIFTTKHIRYIYLNDPTSFEAENSKVIEIMRKFGLLLDIISFQGLINKDEERIKLFRDLILFKLNKKTLTQILQFYIKNSELGCREKATLWKHVLELE